MAAIARRSCEPGLERVTLLPPLRLRVCEERSGMAPLSPASFAPQVTAFFATNLKPNMSETHALWAKVVAAEPGLAKRFAADSHSCSEQLLHLVARLSPALILRDGSCADAWRTVTRNGKHNKKGGGKGNGPAKTFAQPNARASPTKGSGKGGNKGGG